MSTDESSKTESRQATVKGFLTLSRLPFLLPGVAALVSAIAIATGQGFEPDLGLVSISIFGIILIMLATYYFNEYYDYEGDIINRTFIRFSGGSRALVDHNVPRRIARIAGWSSVAALVVMAVAYIAFYFDDYPYLLPLALLGAFCGIFYSHPPFQWAYKGVGEIMIGLCYGPLAMVSGYYLASGVLEPDIIAVSIPAALTIFCVIVANEFPDYDADKAVNKRNLMVRLGLERGSVVYVIAMMLVYPAMVATIAVSISPFIAIFGLPVLLLCVLAILATRDRGYEKRDSQIKISGMTLVANLLSSLLFIPIVFTW